MNFIDFNSGDLQDMIDTDKLVAYLIGCENVKDFTVLNYLGKHRKNILDNLKIFMLYVKLLHSTNTKSKDSYYHRLFYEFITDTLDSSTPPDSTVDGLFTFDLFNELNAFPFGISIDPIYTMHEARHLLETYGENTLPKILLDFVNEHICEDNTRDDIDDLDEDLDDELDDELDDTLGSWPFDPYDIDTFKYVESSLTYEQLDFILSKNNSRMYCWQTHTLSSNELNSFIKENLENKDILNKLFSLTRDLICLSASNLATVSDMRVVNLGLPTTPYYVLECVSFENRYEIPDLGWLDLHSFKQMYELNSNLESLISCS